MCERYCTLPGLEPALGDVKFILGNGPELVNFKTQIASGGLGDRSVIVGEVPHSKVVDFYRAADIILLPSTKSDDVEEATSLSMLEGMACGKLVIVSAIGGMKEVISDGVNGYLFEDKNIPSLIAKLEKGIRDQTTSTRLGEAAMAYVKARNGYFNHAKRYLDFASGAVPGDA